MIEDDAAGSLQKTAGILMMGQIDESGYRESFCLQIFNDAESSFGPAVRRIQWINNDRAVIMKGHPVIHKDGVWCHRLGCVVEHEDVHASLAQAIDHQIEFDSRPARNLSTAELGDIFV